MKMRQGGQTADGRYWIVGATFVACLVNIAVLVWTIGSPLTDLHGFRQTQTAISVYWMLHGGSWLNYETPVLGSGWSIPFEFPLYQGIVAALTHATGAPLVVVGRAVSWAWLASTIYPVAMLVRAYRLRNTTVYYYTFLAAMSPVYLFWGRAFLIETQALSLGLYFLAYYKEYLLRRKIAHLIAAVLFNAVLDLTKITTALAFVIVAAAQTLEHIFEDRRQPRRIATTLAAGALAVLPGLIAFVIWNHHADALKSLNPLALDLRSGSSEMIEWNFGTLKQRSLPSLAKLMGRATTDVLGWLSTILIAFIATAFFCHQRRDRKEIALALVLVLAWIAPFFIFTNLHIVHNYYQAGNAIFLVMALAVALPTIAGSSVFIPAVLLTIIAVSQLSRFATSYLPSLKSGGDEPSWKVGLTAKRLTDPSTGLLIVGRDWSPVVPFYAERKAVMIYDTAPRRLVLDIAARPEHFMEGIPFGGAIICPSPLTSDPKFAIALKRLERGLEGHSVEGCMVYSKSEASHRMPT